ncbi:hypothetical protein [Nocardioides sp.]|uniref:hypothetical protein n=1 Tax=Nocardioides sp. TaxID=35761 RepID=UPI00262E4F36|nr:hypothetical protein [Nocardioides sp.]MCW2739560.1 hypothetical protein [Nocardioides sp.]
MKLISGLAAVALAATVLVQPATAATDVPAPAPARAGTGWLATQLTDGVIHNDTYDYDDLGMTMDIGLSMDEVGGDQALVRQLRASLAPRIEEYAAPAPTERYSGALAKSLVFAQVSGADPATYGGLDLVAETEARVIAAGPSAGRLQDLSAYGDYANSFGQALAVRGLSDAGSAKAAPVTDFLLQQQCSSGFFRIFFTTDPDAPGQSCTEGVDGTDTDATAFVIGQLAAVSPRPARVDAAIDRAVAWLVATQKADGSFVGSAYTPDSNTNSTGLAASALAAAGRCEQAGKAAEWVSGLQVAPQPSTSPLAGEEGALAYDATALSTAAAGGISDGARDQWWRATLQAVAGLTHYRGSTQGLTITSAGTEPGSASTLSATGAKVGERFCLSGPGISGSRTVVVGTDGTLEARVTLPAASGPATYTLSGRDGTATHTVAVKSSTARGSVAGVRLVGPAGFRRAGSRVALEVVGAAPGARFALGGPGLSDVTVVAGSDGVLTRTVTLPKATTTASYVLSGGDGQVSDETRVLGATTLKVSALAGHGPRTRVLVRRLAPRETVRLVIAGETVARGRANAKGRFVARVVLPTEKARVRIRAVGQFAAIRSGSTTHSLR